MNDLGLTLTWLAVQVTILLVPALALNALASRYEPAVVCSGRGPEPRAGRCIERRDVPAPDRVE